MAKKVKIQKLLKSPGVQQSQSTSSKPSYKSAFSSHSEKLQRAKQKKIEKVKETRDRLMNKNKHNVSVKMQNSRLGLKSNKINKFALLDDRDGQAQARYEPQNKLTHRGTEVGKIKHFNDMHFDNDDQNENYDNEEFDQMHGEANFHGFDDENNANQNRQQGNSNIRKSKNEIYKQIIQKSRSHKRDRQQQYEQNFNKAVELDQKFSQFVSNLKFRNNDAKVRQKLANRDLQYQRLLNQLKDEQRVVASRVADNSKKGIQKIKKKKNVQLGQLMKQASDDQDEEDIRGWVKGLDQDQQQNDEDNSNQQAEENDGQQGQDDESEDQIDDVQLSSGDQEEEQNQGEGQQDENDQNDQQGHEIKGQNFVIQSASQDSKLEQPQQDDDLNEQQQQQQEDQQQEIVKKNKKIVKNTQNKYPTQSKAKPSHQNHNQQNKRQPNKRGKQNGRKHK